MTGSCVKEDKQKLFDLLKREAFFKEKVVLSSGKESDYYMDARRVTLKAEGAYLCGKIILDMAKNEKFDAIGGPTLGADPIVGAIGVLSFQSGKPVNTFIVRKAPKPHGKQQQVEGPLLAKGSKVILIDDVATTGKAFLQSIDVLNAMGIETPQAICIVDRGEGAKEALAQKKCALASVFSVQEFLR